MAPLLLSEPWDLHSDSAETFQLTGSTSSSIISGSGSPRIIAPFGLETRYGPRRKFLPRISFPFRWGGDICIAFQLPLNHRPKKTIHDFSVDIFLPDGIHDVIQSDVVGRPDADHGSDLGRKLDSFIEWQIHCFSELALAIDESTSLEMEEKSQKIMRRNWHSVRRVWIDVDKTEAIMALIVKLAQDNDLLRVFESIARRPRRILLRYRENTQLHRIQELDSACIRDLARRPGHTVAEKAGSRQKLLAVRRHASVETMENQVYRWVLDRMIRRAKDYVATNRHHASSNRVQAVARCTRRCNAWSSSEHFQTVSFDQLQHPIQPNYSLQMDERYRHVYRTYRELLREQHVRDDAWEWQRILWAESARQLVGCTLTEFFREENASTPYYRFEGEHGVWTESPIGPGPFKTKAGPCIVIDSRDVLVNPYAWIKNPPFDFALYLGTLGCDQVLFWPSSRTLLIIWFMYWTGESEQIRPMISRSGKALRIFSLDIARFTYQHYRCLGLVLITDPQATGKKPGVELEIWPDDSKMPEVVGLRIPFTIDQTDSVEFKKLIDDFRTGIQMVIDEAIAL